MGSYTSRDQTISLQILPAVAMDNRVSNFRLFLHNISEELGSDELESLKFLCHDTLTKARLEKIKNTKELFVAIGEVREDEEKQLDLLQQLFINIRRLDLVSKVEKFQQTKKGKLHFAIPDDWKQYGRQWVVCNATIKARRPCRCTCCWCNKLMTSQKSQWKHDLGLP